MRLVRPTFVATMAAIALAACTPQTPPPPDVAAIRTSLEAANTKFTNAMKAGDTATAFANYSDDAVVMMPNQKPWRGRAEWAAGFGGLLAVMTIKDAAFTTSDVTVSNDLAIETGTYSMTLVPKGGPEIKDEGKYLTVWKRQADSSWKIIRDISNTSLPGQ